jgi:hypothetical protein
MTLKLIKFNQILTDLLYINRTEQISSYDEKSYTYVYI